MSSDKNSHSNLRSEIREIANANASVEFKLVDLPLAYHFKLRDFSSQGMGILIKKDSKILNHLHVGDIYDMLYHPEQATTNPVSLKTKIIHISEPETGKYKDHFIVGLSIVK